MSISAGVSSQTRVVVGCINDEEWHTSKDRFGNIVMIRREESKLTSMGGGTEMVKEETFAFPPVAPLAKCIFTKLKGVESGVPAPVMSRMAAEAGHKFADKTSMTVGDIWKGVSAIGDKEQNWNKVPNFSTYQASTHLGMALVACAEPESRPADMDMSDVDVVVVGSNIAAVYGTGNVVISESR